jgi:general secretion pathway protein J
MTSAHRPRIASRGFTLVELLVALFITAIIFVLGYGGLNQGLHDRDAIASSQARINAIQTTMRLFAQDFVQLTPRQVRDPLGTGWDPPLLASTQTSGTAQGTQLVVLTRGGWANPAGIQRSQLQRVRWVLEKDALRREHWRVLDALLASEPVKRPLLDHVRAVKLRFMSPARVWQDEWPGATSVAAPPPPPPLASGAVLPPQPAPMPLAVEITLDLEDWGTITRIFEVPG